ncbi:MAG: hypothetical protein PHV34_14800 [Verrucomicrobiae bacterium]|nr:hypothetical protein [Verrucomicrobiae bacterium]
MDNDFPRKTADEIIKALATRFRESARDRRVYSVLGTYDQLDKFVPRIRDLCHKNALSEDGQSVAFFDLNTALLEHLKLQGKMEKLSELADKLRDKELGRLMGENWSDWLSQQTGKHFGLILAGFELFFSYLDSNALALVRQYAINGKHLCLVMPGTERARQVWAFDETPDFRRQITGLVSEWTYVLTAPTL